MSVYQKTNTDSLFHLVLKRRVNVCEVALNIGNVTLKCDNLVINIANVKKENSGS